MVLGVAGAVVVGLWAFASMDRCGEWTAGRPALTGLARARGPLRVGAAKQPISPVFPVVVGGYGPWRSEASSSGALAARAVVLESAGVRFGMVELDALLVTAPLVEAIRAERGFPLWVTAVHAHSSLGGYDRRAVAQVAALGRFREDEERALVDAARKAVDAAVAALKPSTLEVTQGQASGLSVARTSDSVDERLTRLRFLDTGGAAMAQWLVLSAHPTLVERRTTVLDADYPGALAAEGERAGVITFVLQGAAGNASAALGPSETAQGFATRVGKAFGALPEATVFREVDLALATARLSLPRPDGSRLAPGFAVAALENVLCDGAEREVEVAALRLGPVSFLAVPGEPSRAAGLVLEEQSGATRALGNTNGYLGYVELEAAVRGPWGEAHHQYFGPELLGHLGAAARLVGSAAGISPVK